MLDQFAEKNDRMSEMVRFWSLASEIGVDLRHLDLLRKDEDAVTLGVQKDASLAFAVSDTSRISQSFELDSSWDNVLSKSELVDGQFAVFDWNGRKMLQENCIYFPREENSIDQQTRNRINALVELLYQPKEKVFCTLILQGWRLVAQSQRVAYLFNIPSSVRPEPKSLLRLLHDSALHPSLGIKFRLAYNLAQSLSQFHLVNWVRLHATISILKLTRCRLIKVHESFRSENILFFPPNRKPEDTSNGDSIETKVEIEQPWIFGFGFSRPEFFFSQGFVDTCPDRDVYRSSERQGLPVTVFKKIHDVYALGVVLLETGKSSRCRKFSPP